MFAVPSYCGAEIWPGDSDAEIIGPVASELGCKATVAAAAGVVVLTRVIVLTVTLPSGVVAVIVSVTDPALSVVRLGLKLQVPVPVTTCDPVSVVVPSVNE